MIRMDAGSPGGHLIAPSIGHHLGAVPHRTNRRNSVIPSERTMPPRLPARPDVRSIGRRTGSRGAAIKPKLCSFALDSTIESRVGEARCSPLGPDSSAVTSSISLLIRSTSARTVGSPRMSLPMARRSCPFAWFETYRYSVQT